MSFHIESFQQSKKYFIIVIGMKLLFALMLLPSLLGAEKVFTELIVQMHIRGGALGAPEIVDLDKDGIPDYVFVGTREGYLHCWRVKKVGRKIKLLPKFTRYTRDGFEHWSPKVADIDGDGESCIHIFLDKTRC
jgi:hypothetical protein